MSCFDLFYCARRVDSGHRDREVIKNLSTTASANGHKHEKKGSLVPNHRPLYLSDLQKIDTVLTE
jgi:hypothetical protein